MPLAAGALPDKDFPVPTKDAKFVSRVLDLGKTGLVGAEDGDGGALGDDGAGGMPGNRLPLGGEGPTGSLPRSISLLERRVLHLVGDVLSADEKSIERVRPSPARASRRAWNPAATPMRSTRSQYALCSSISSA